MASLIIRMVLSLETKVGIMAGCGGLYKFGRAELVQTEVARTEVAQTELKQTELTQT